MCICIFEHSLTFWYCRIFQAYLMQSPPQFQNKSFPLGNPTISHGKKILETKICVSTCLLLLGRHCSSAISFDRTRTFIYMYKYNLCRYIQLCLLPCATIFNYSKPSMSSYWCLRHHYLTTGITLSSRPCSTLILTSSVQHLAPTIC